MSWQCLAGREHIGSPRWVAQGVQAVPPGRVLGQPWGMVSRALPSHLVQRCSCHMTCAAADRLGKGCSKMDIKEKLLMMKT